jgi:hypothetical protein
MNNINNSSGIYDITSYNLTSNNATILSTLNVGGSVIGPNTILSINILNATTTTILNHLNSLSTYSNLNISNLQSTSTTTFDNLNSLSTYSSLNISNLQSTSTSIFNNLNSLSTNSILLINNKPILIIYMFLVYLHYYHH